MDMQSKAKKLIEMIQTAPVEWKPLGGENGIAIIKTGQAVSKQKISNNIGSYPVINSGKEPLGYIDEWNTENDPIGITTRGAGVGSITWQEGRYFRGNLNYAVTIKDRTELDVRFLYHILLEFEQEIHALCTFTGIPALNASNLKKLLIPIPPLEIQQKIVKILDKFTELEATLEAELQLRKQQYNYYRDFLLNFAGREDVLFKKLSEVTNFQNGKGHEKDISESGKFIVVNSKFISTNGQVLKYSDKQLVPLFEDDILIVMSDLPNGKVLSKTYLVKQNNKFTLNQRIGRITVKNKSELLPKFVSYFLDRTRQLTKYDNKVDQTNLRKEQILEVFIPIPPLSEQARIVAILDKFDTLTTSLSDGLPREIALRRKQYEYYREQLLAFPKAA
ncbi:MAG: restriction endonuclease subunit S [Neisseria elongata]